MDDKTKHNEIITLLNNICKKIEPNKTSYTRQLLEETHKNIEEISNNINSYSFWKIHFPPIIITVLIAGALLGSSLLLSNSISEAAKQDTKTLSKVYKDVKTINNKLDNIFPLLNKIKVGKSEHKKTEKR